LIKAWLKITAAEAVVLYKAIKVAFSEVLELTLQMQIRRQRKCRI